MFPGKFQPKETENPVLEQSKMEKPDVSKDDEDGLREWNPDEGSAEKKLEVYGKKPEEPEDDEDGLHEWNPGGGSIEKEPEIYGKKPEDPEDDEDGLREWNPDEGSAEKELKIYGKKPEEPEDGEDGLCVWNPDEGSVEKEPEIYSKKPEEYPTDGGGLIAWEPDKPLTIGKEGNLGGKLGEHPEPIEEKGEVAAKTADVTFNTILPRNGGEWSGERGNSRWWPNRDEIPKDRHGTNPEHKTWDEILNEYGIDSIPFVDGYPDFSEVSKGQVEIDDFTEDRDANFPQADEKLAEQRGCTAKEVREWREANGYTWHECKDCKTMQKVPTEVHGNVSHSGGISVYKSQHTDT